MLKKPESSDLEFRSVDLQKAENGARAALPWDSGTGKSQDVGPSYGLSVYYISAMRDSHKWGTHVKILCNNPQKGHFGQLTKDPEKRHHRVR